MSLNKRNKSSMSSPIWQKLIWSVMFLVVCEGAIRKWIVPGQQQAVYFVKDFLLIVAYLAFLSSRAFYHGTHLGVMIGLKVLLICSAIYFGFEILNPNSPSILLSLVGFKNYILYPPLAFVVPYMFASSEDVERKLRSYAVIMLPFAALGIVQFAFGPEHWINGYLAQDSENLRLGSMFGTPEMMKARTTGTFSFIGGYTTFLTVMFYLAAGLAASRSWRLAENKLPLALLAISLAAMFTTGSRGPIWGVLLFSPFVLYVWAFGGLMSTRTFVQMALAAVVVYVGVILLVPDAIEAYQYRTHYADDPVERLTWGMTENYDALVGSPPLGTGMASTHGAAISIMGTTEFWWLNGVGVEGEPARVLLETGTMGFIIVFAARIWLLLSAMRFGSKFRTPLYVSLSGAIAGFLALNVTGIVINNPTGGIYFWFAAGLLFAMYRAEMQDAMAREVSRFNLVRPSNELDDSAPSAAGSQ
jgi:hypothetical protein